MEWEKNNLTRTFPPPLFHSDSDNHSNDDAFDVPPWPPLFSLHVTTTTIFVLNSVVGLPLMSIGILCNILNMAVFARQGFKDTINISLTSLTVCDLAFHVHTLWQTVSMMPSLDTAHWPFDFGQIAIITGSIPRVYFTRVSSCVTVFIAVERCLSVTRPLQVKLIFTRKRIILSEIGIYVFNGLPFILSFMTVDVGWKFDPFRNRTYLGVSIFQGNTFFNNFGLSFGIFLLFSTFITVALCTVILVWKLNQLSRRRAHMVEGPNTRNTTTSKGPTGVSSCQLPSTDVSDDKPGAHSRDDKPGAHSRDGKPGAHSRDDKPGAHSRDDKPGAHSRDDKPGAHSRDDKPGAHSRDDKPGPHSRDDKPGAHSRDDKPGAHSMSERDKRAAMTVTLLAAMFVFCYLPTVLFQLVILVVPEFSRRGRYRNAYRVVALIGLRAGGICGTANILVYFRTSTKFRDSLRSLLCCVTKTS